MRIEVTRFADQIEALAGGVDDGPGSLPVGYLAVVPGPGLVALVRAAGAVAVDGAAGSLPTVATVLNAVGDVRADDVVLLPGHPNVVPTMHQASAVSVAEGGRPLHVVDSADSVPAVLAVLAMGSPDTVDLDALATVARDVRCGEVVAAVRDAETPLGPVRAGQLLAVVGGVVVGAHDDPAAAIHEVADSIIDPGIELVTLVAGADVDEAERSDVHDQVMALAPGAEVQLVLGEQHPVRWIIGAE